MPEHAPLPLTLGQKSVWRDISSLTPQDRSGVTLSASVPLPSGIEDSDVRTALSLMMQRHEVLRTRFSPEGQRGPVHQTVCPPEGVEIPLTHGSAKDASVPSPASADIEVVGGLPWRATINRDDQGQSHLELRIHHLATDYQGLTLLADDVHDALTKPGAQTIPSTGPRTILALESGEREKKITSRAVNRWQDILTRAVPTHRLVRQQNVLEGKLRSAQLTAVVRERSAKCGAPPSVLLLDAYCAAVLEMDGPEDRLIRTMVSNRFDLPRQRIVASMNQWSPLLVNRNTHSLAETARKAMFAARYGVYDADEVERVLLSTGHQRDALDHAPSFNYVSAPVSSRSRAADATPRRELTFTAIGVPVGPTHYLRAVMTSELSLTLRIPDSDSSRATAEQLLEHIERRVLQA
ncbi:hypothetical protein GCM10010331_70500 [Streptomyces xanthochromogenes]|uniref:condensation domain-containing protein n=1 Tax=Streptomyces xanthochromogenes TaxID=67384 RepID=UPI001678B6C8|nr:condensation domain-containing protein [Streptomyces xanthochromogenes]GHB72267.1 hypothetical protein GCM10010331_70500 [Streptomyces xanthochromogenes]